MIAESTANAYLSYENSLKIEAYTFILDLLLPFILSLAMIRSVKGKLLFGVVGGASLIGVGLSIPAPSALGGPTGCH
ncbi:hypothetical protein [Acidilobus sp.]|uniref:hypothetical protein n=1 Tax=Acidilobus sp. TaxID=1872109 RepID=UPI003D076351